VLVEAHTPGGSGRGEGHDGGHEGEIEFHGGRFGRLRFVSRVLVMGLVLGILTYRFLCKCADRGIYFAFLRSEKAPFIGLLFPYSAH
jgi:hypothetical protein